MNDYKNKTTSIIAILTIMVLLFSSCSTDSTRKPGYSKAGKKSEITLYFTEIAISIPSEKRIKKWEDYMQDKYSVDISLNYLSKAKEGIDTEKLLELSGGEGLVLVNSYSELMELITNDMIIPLDFYHDTVNEFPNINAGMTESLTDSFGTLWGVPLRKGDPFIDKRIYNKEWLDGIGVDTPESVEEFYDYAVYVATGDPDGNGIHDTYIAEYTSRDLFSQFRDVFKAFGCYSSYQSPIGFNPLNMRIENFITDGNFKEAMEYIKVLVDQGLVINAETSKQNYKIASTMDYWWKDSDAEKEYGFFLTGPNSKMLIEERYTESCMAVLKHTDNPKEKLDTLYELIYSSSDSFMDFAFGIKDEDYFDMIDCYNVKVVSDDPQEQIAYEIGIYTDINRPGLSIKPVIHSNDPEVKIATAKHMDEISESWDANEAVKMYLDTELSYRPSFDVYIEGTTLEGSSMIYRIKLIDDILVNNIPIEDAVEEYRWHLRD